MSTGLLQAAIHILGHPMLVRLQNYFGLSHDEPTEKATIDGRQGVQTCGKNKALIYAK
ncbi:MAG: hypothetical protein V3V50_00925 [Gammaproteobacteria bacterium]